MELVAAIAKGMVKGMVMDEMAKVVAVGRTAMVLESWVEAGQGAREAVAEWAQRRCLLFESPRVPEPRYSLCTIRRFDWM